MPVNMLQAMKYQYFNKPTPAMDKNDCASCGCVVGKVQQNVP